MRQETRDAILKILKALLLAVFKLLLFAFWVLSSAALVLLKELNETVKRYLFKK